MHNPGVTPDPGTFDPMRSYRKRYLTPEARNTHLAGQISPDDLLFGYGRMACPGRAFAVAETKIMLAKLLSDFEFKLPEDRRYESLSADEIVYPHPEARIFIRKKESLM